MIAFGFNSTANVSTNMTINSITNRTEIFIIAVFEAFLTIALNSFLLGLCAKIPTQARNQLHIFYTFLAASDLINGVYLLLLSASFFFLNSNIFKNYNVCLSVIIMSSVGPATTGYLLLLMTAIKSFSVVCPLKGLQYITRRAALCLSSVVWIFSYAVIIIPSIFWARKNVFPLYEECDMRAAYQDKFKQFVTLALVLSGGFIAGVLVFNSFILLKITRRNKIGNQGDNKSNSSSGKRLNRKSTENKNSPEKIEVRESRDEKLQLNEHISQINTKRYDFKESKNFKAYLTVLLQIGLYMLCGFPYFLVITNQNLKMYFYNDRNVRIQLHKSYILDGEWECALLELSFVPKFPTPERRVFFCSDFVIDTYAREKSLPILQSAGVLNEDIADIVFEKPIYLKVTRNELYQIEFVLRNDNLKISRPKDDHFWVAAAASTAAAAAAEAVPSSKRGIRIFWVTAAGPSPERVKTNFLGGSSSSFCSFL
ncbi:unnamed protein product [Mytilus coruscus]|uniref:G-protein coupled receptors family 1 profile domain-containing protein n=1 Tax=Mytilus coruscus TaxID=42192 RepID=A0A6J8BP97_MYTCO|nr:unnamed protein product [Mytilus coruscus]